MFASDVVIRADEVRESPDLAALAHRLWDRTEPLRARPLNVPAVKALLSQDGGVCARDGARLVFEPLSPERHACPQCGAVYEGERHHRAWVWRYHLWLSERAIHFALLHALGVEPDAHQKAREILIAYATQYHTYPNRDNVLGPTRLFFSTYLESIWLIQIVIASALLDASVSSRESVRPMLEGVIAESSTLIRSFNEGWSNRQVWNNAAMLAAGAYLGDDALMGHAVEGRYGIARQLQQMVSPTGWWFEGENYHFFALRGFLLAAEVLRCAGWDLYKEPSTQRIGSMYAAPLETLLPDLTLPARGDSPSDVSVVQARFAELWEIGWARTADPRLGSVLHDIYGSHAEGGPDYGFWEIAEQEQNRLPASLTRTALGWKALLWMTPHLAPALEGWQAQTTLVSPRGPLILRPAPGRYVGLEGAGTGPGHGHPDRLHLTLVDGEPILKDFGTGSYVSESLHWYRSSLAHNAPAPPGGQHADADGWCAGFGVRDQWTWGRAVAVGFAGPGTSARRTVIIAQSYVADVVDVDVPPTQTIELPIHPLGGVSLDDIRLGQACPIDVGARADVVHARPLREPLERIAIRSKDARIILMPPRATETVWVASAPGPPTLALGDPGSLSFVIRRATGPGRWVQVYATPSSVRSVGIDDGRIHIRHDRATDILDVGHDEIRIRHGGGTVVLSGGLPRPMVAVPQPSWQLRAPAPALRCARLGHPAEMQSVWDDLPVEATFVLGLEHYRRSEDPFPGEDRLTARVGVCAAGTHLYFVVDVHKGNLFFRAGDAADPRLDNEHPDIHSDGVQVYVSEIQPGGARRPPCWKGFLAVPVEGGVGVRVHPVRGTDAESGELTGEWVRIDDGYRVLVTYETGSTLEPGMTFDCAVAVNEMYPGRNRRAGQLSSGGGGWVYLRGDRESRANAISTEVQ